MGHVQDHGNVRASMGNALMGGVWGGRVEGVRALGEV